MPPKMTEAEKLAKEEDKEIAYERSIDLKHCGRLAEEYKGEHSEYLCKLFKLMSTHDEAGARAIGVELNKNGGWAAMSEIYEAFKRAIEEYVKAGNVRGNHPQMIVLSNPRLLESYWSGVGDWLD